MALSQTISERSASNLVALLPNIKELSMETFTLLNSPIFPEAITYATSRALKTVTTICNRAPLLDPHSGLFILTNYTSAPRLSLIQRHNLPEEY